MKDLLGHDIPDEKPATSRNGKVKRKPTRQTGHFMKAGTGPAGESCGTCVFRIVRGRGRKYQKCHRARKIWTAGPGSDIRARDRACGGWMVIPEAIVKVEAEQRSIARKLPKSLESSYRGGRKVHETCEDRKTKARRPLTIEEEQARERDRWLSDEHERLYKEAFHGF